MFLQNFSTFQGHFRQSGDVSGVVRGFQEAYMKFKGFSEVFQEGSGDFKVVQRRFRWLS